MQKVAEHEIVDFAKTQLTLPDKIDPSDAMSWQHHLYSKLGSKKPNTSPEGVVATTKSANQQALLDELVDRIVAMAKVLFGLHMVTPFHSIFIFKSSFHVLLFYDFMFLCEILLKTLIARVLAD